MITMRSNAMITLENQVVGSDHTYDFIFSFDLFFCFSGAATSPSKVSQIFFFFFGHFPFIKLVV